jgi:hypothetical protein
MTWLDGLVAVSPILAIVAAGLYRMHLDHKETMRRIELATQQVDKATGEKS